MYMLNVIIERRRGSADTHPALSHEPAAPRLRLTGGISTRDRATEGGASPSEPSTQGIHSGRQTLGERARCRERGHTIDPVLRCCITHATSYPLHTQYTHRYACGHLYNIHLVERWRVFAGLCRNARASCPPRSCAWGAAARDNAFTTQLATAELRFRSNIDDFCSSQQYWKCSIQYIHSQSAYWHAADSRPGRFESAQHRKAPCTIGSVLECSVRSGSTQDRGEIKD